MKKPKKVSKIYLAGLSPEEKKKRAAEIRRRSASKNPSHSPMATDFDKDGKLRKTKTSGHTKKYKKQFGGKKRGSKK